MKAFLGFLILLSVGTSWSADVLMVTMGGTKSHKIPFLELARGLIARGHNITFLSGFPADFSINGLHEITPAGLVDYIQNYTNWDLVGARMAGEMPIPLWDAIRYTFQSCDSMLEDAETKELLNRSFDLAILDGAFPECALGLVYKFKCPFMYINTVGFYMGSISLTGNPATFSITPAVFSTFTDNMNLIQRAMNTILSISMNLIHVFVATSVHTVLKKHFGSDIPHVYDMSRNVSVILQNSHATVSYPRPFLPNIVEIACIHCRPPGPLPKDLENFVNSSGESGFIYVSMGSSVKAVNMPEHLRKLLVQTFARLPYHVLWKWEGSNSGMHDLTPNVKLNRWLPQQDILGHKKLRAFITHGGLLSMLETIYHGVPIVTMPVFCDHDVNAAKGEVDGYAIKLNLETLSSDKLYKAIIKVIHDTRYRNAAKIRQRLLLDQRTSPLDTAVYWTEYVIRHKGAYHLQTPARNMSWIEYYLVDVFALYILIIMSIVYIIKKLLKYEILRILKKKQKLQ